VTSDGIAFGSATSSGTPFKLPFAEVQSVELFPGDRNRMIFVTPRGARRLGSVVITTTDGRAARFSGIPAEGLQEALTRQGANIFVGQHLM
jgi:hypothetical protein